MTEDQNPSDGGCFSGDERLEPFPLIGRLIRKGHPAQLAIPDADRVRVALNAGNGELAAGYLSIIRANCEGMVFVYGEFIPAFADVLERRTPRLDFLPSLRRAHQRFERLTGERETFRGHPETAQVLDAFHPRRVSPRMVTELREGLVKGLPGFIGEMVRPPSTAIDSTLKAIGTGHYDEALSTFERYYASMRRLHDLLVEFVSLWIAAIRELHGETVAEGVLYEAFTTCLFYEGLWAAVRGMSHEETAAFLADHLRGHFSGAAREGAVTIVDEPDRYRLIFDPCGSGGAMRRGAISGLADAAQPFLEPSAQTWGTEGQVPGYCTHCAINELESMRRLGYPILVTEFESDPQKPCGWTVYKDPNLIPERYFTRLGFERDPSRFVR